MLQPLNIDSAKILENKWQQGACLEVYSDEVIYIYTQDKTDSLRLKKGTYVLLSQDCDIVSSCLNKEPVVELIEANKIPQINPEFCSGKNPRRLHVPVEGESYSLEFLPYERYFILRPYLESLSPARVSITSKELKILLRWIIKRFVRPGFPDAFNRRINSKNIKQLKKFLGSDAKESLGLFIRLSTEKELPDTETYKVLIIMLVSKEAYDDEVILQKIRETFDQILNLLDGINGIEVIEGSQVQSVDEISLHRYQELKQWDFDYLSFSSGEEGEVIRGDL